MDICYDLRRSDGINKHDKLPSPHPPLESSWLFVGLGYRQLFSYIHYLNYVLLLLLDNAGVD